MPVHDGEAPGFSRGVEVTATTVSHRAIDTDGEYFLDADLAVLGSDWERYQRYAQAIRKEYAWASMKDYRAGRQAVLREFLKRDRIFTTPEFSNLEDQARYNIRVEIDALGDL